jgi:hydrophobe/amphiphile efflux-3 (HAE3) family protein
MTMVSMAVFPILIGLGIDYSIQFQNRYEEEHSVKTTLVQIGKAVGLAVLATVLGFVSLFASPVPMIQDFGKMITIGVIVSFIGSIFLLMPVLSARDTVASKARDFRIKDYEKAGPIDKFLRFTVNSVIKLAPLIIIIAIGLATFGLIADTKVGVETDIETFMPQDMDALHDIHYIRDIVGSTNQMVIFMEDEELLTEDNLSWMRDISKQARAEFSNKIVDIKYIDNLVENFSDIEEISFDEYLEIIDNDIPESQRRMFISDEKDKAVILMNVEHMATAELQEFVEDMKIMLEDAPIKTSITGKSVLDVEMVKGLTDGRLRMTIIGLGLVFLSLLILYRSFFKALVAVLPVVLIVGMSGGIMNLLGLKYTPLTATLGALVLGMGTEMTIMLLERYLEERNEGKDKRKALFTTIKFIGKATLASGLTTVGGFSVLMTSKFVILKDFGLMTVINISLALMATFIILPALIWILDRFIVSDKVKKEAYKEVPQE